MRNDENILLALFRIMIVALFDLCKIQQPQLAISNVLMCIEIKISDKNLLDNQCRCYMYLLLCI